MRRYYWNSEPRPPVNFGEFGFCDLRWMSHTILLNGWWKVVQVAGFQNRIEYFERMVAANPDNPTGLLALANEYHNAKRDEDEAAVLERYVAVHSDDEGNAYARLGDVLARLGREDEARTAYERGIRQAEKYGHTGMAEDLRLAIIQLGEQD